MGSGRSHSTTTQHRKPHSSKKPHSSENQTAAKTTQRRKPHSCKNHTENLGECQYFRMSVVPLSIIVSLQVDIFEFYIHKDLDFLFLRVAELQNGKCEAWTVNINNPRIQKDDPRISNDWVYPTSNSHTGKWAFLPDCGGYFVQHVTENHISLARFGIRAGNPRI